MPYSLKWPLNTLKCTSMHHCVLLHFTFHCTEHSQVCLRPILCPVDFQEFLCVPMSVTPLDNYPQSSCSEFIRRSPLITEKSCRSKVMRGHQSWECSCHLRVELRTLHLHLRQRDRAHFQHTHPSASPDEGSKGVCVSKQTGTWKWEQCSQHFSLQIS